MAAKRVLVITNEFVADHDVFVSDPIPQNVDGLLRNATRASLRCRGR